MANWKSFEDMDLWKKACRLACEVYEATREGALERDYAMRDQVRRSAISLPSNAAEGFERDSPKAFANFLLIAKGSAGELRTQLYIASKPGYLSANRARELVSQVKEISRMASGLIQKLKKDVRK